MTILNTLQVIKRFIERISFALPTRQTPRHSLDVMTFIIKNCFKLEKRKVLSLFVVVVVKEGLREEIIFFSFRLENSK